MVAYSGITYVSFINSSVFWVITQPTKPEAGRIKVNRSGRLCFFEFFCSLLDVFSKFRKATISLVMSVIPSVRTSARNSSAPTGRILIKFDI